MRENPRYENQRSQRYGSDEQENRSQRPRGREWTSAHNDDQNWFTDSREESGRNWDENRNERGGTNADRSSWQREYGRHESDPWRNDGGATRSGRGFQGNDRAYDFPWDNSENPSRSYGQQQYGPQYDRPYGQQHDRPYGQQQYGQNQTGYGRSTQGQYGQYGSGQGQSGFGQGQSGYRQFGQGQHYGQDQGAYGQSSFGQSVYGQSGFGQPLQGQSNYGQGNVRDRGMQQDQSWQGSQQSFHGKGPKGYQRSDDRIREDVCDCLEQHPGIDASQIEIKVEAGVVTLSGTVDERMMKRLAEDATESVRGVKDVTNNVRIEAKGEKSDKGDQASQKQNDHGTQSQQDSKSDTNNRGNRQPVGR